MDTHEVVHRIHMSARTTLSQVWLEFVTWSMDWIAFWGNVFGPITYFYPDEAIYRSYVSFYPGNKDRQIILFGPSNHWHLLCCMDACVFLFNHVPPSTQPTITPCRT